VDRLQKAGQSRRGLVLRNWIQFLKRAGECVREAPHGSRLELLVHRLEIQVMDPSRQVLREALLTLDECLVDQQFGRSIGQLPRLPFLDLPLQRPEIPLHPINSDGKAVFQQEILGMFGQHWREHSRDNVAKLKLSSAYM